LPRISWHIDLEVVSGQRKSVHRPASDAVRPVFPKEHDLNPTWGFFVGGMRECISEKYLRDLMAKRKWVALVCKTKSRRFDL
jgi:hypothetical protein